MLGDDDEDEEEQKETADAATGARRAGAPDASHLQRPPAQAPPRTRQPARQPPPPAPPGHPARKGAGDHRPDHQGTRRQERASGSPRKSPSPDVSSSCLPFDGKIGISKKITSFKEKRRLRKIVQAILPEGFGVIIRTVAEGKDESSLKNDLEGPDRDLARGREDGQERKGPVPALQGHVHHLQRHPGSLLQRRHPRGRSIHGSSTRRSARTSSTPPPQLLDKIELHKDTRADLRRATASRRRSRPRSRRKVWLKSGGYIIIEPTEAMVVIDVNSGRYAAEEGAGAELAPDRPRGRARNHAGSSACATSAGIIVCDFIDLDDERNKRKVFEELKKEFRQGPREGDGAPDDGVRARADHPAAHPPEHPAQLHRAVPGMRRHRTRAVEDHDPEPARTVDPPLQDRDRRDAAHPPRQSRSSR